MGEKDLQQIEQVLQEVILEFKKQPFYQVLKTCDLSGNPQFTMYYTHDGQVMFKDLSGNGLQQGVDFVICEDDKDDFDQIFQFDNIITSPEDGVFIRDNMGQVYRFTVTEYGAVVLDPTNKTFNDILTG